MKRPLISFKAPVKIRLSALGLICVSLVGLSACGPRPDGKKGPDGKPLAAVAPATPFAAIANGKVDIEGGVIAVAARRAGIVSEVFVKEGDIVKKGDVLARLRGRRYDLGRQFGPRSGRAGSGGVWLDKGTTTGSAA